jgi:hypothetical protein
MNLFENKIELNRSTLGDSKAPIVYIKGDVYPYKDIIKKFGGKWNNPNKVWFWFLDKSDPQKTIDTYIKPALAEIRDIKNIPLEIDEIIAAMGSESPSSNPDISISKADENDVKNKLKAFKEMLVNIESDEEFKDIMGKLVSLKAAQGYNFTLGNTILIMVQNPKATIVNSRSNWEKAYNRKVKPNAKPLFIYAPQGMKKTLTKDEKEVETNKFLASVGKRSQNELTPNEKIKLNTILRGSTYASRFVFAPVFDVSDTEQIEGTEDFIAKANEVKKDIKWFEDNMISDEVRPIYRGLLSFGESKGISIDLVDDLGGARGVSASGAIRLLKNEGNDVGLTKTLVHEIAHELLHQSYLKKKGDEASKFHVGRLDTATVEQQAELSAWMFMYAFGFDVKTTSLNYTVMWGGDKNNMVKVFDTVSGVVNYLIGYVNNFIKNDTLNEIISEQVGKMISPNDIADLLGLSDEYNEIKQGVELTERLRVKVLNKVILD